jgi:hypothetical protein
LKKHGFELTKISHTDKERDAYPTVFMHKKHGAMHTVAEIDGMGYINGEPYAQYLHDLKHDAEEAEGRPVMQTYVHLDLYTGKTSVIPAGEFQQAIDGLEKVRGKMTVYKGEEYMVLVVPGK